MNESEFIFRPYVLEDRAFIESSWASSYYSACKIKDILSPGDFHKFHRPLRERFFERPSATVIVVSPSWDPSFIIGWAAVEIVPNGSLLHYVYIKSAYRKEWGLFEKLLKNALPRGTVIYTHLTHRFGGILKNNPDEFKEFSFCPHLT